MRADATYVLFWQTLAIFLLIGAVVGALLGLLLIFNSSLIQSLNRGANRWVSTRQVERIMDHSVILERWFHRHHKVVGMAIALGALYMLGYFGFQFDKASAVQQLEDVLPADLLGGLLDALVLVLLLGAAVALCIGLFYWLRPSLLRGIETHANRWLSVRGAAEVLDVPHNVVENYVARHSRPIGWLMLAGSIYLAFLMFRLLV